MNSTFSARLWHGADYNPEQWVEMPEVWDADMCLMKQAHMSSATLGVFSWACLEPREGEYAFGWLDNIIEKLTANGQSFVLSTPSAAMPHWMSRNYPEILRVTPEGRRLPHHNRQTQCPTAPNFRWKLAQINGRLAQRYGKHPRLLAWHISNELCRHCYCDLCFEAFRGWLRARYNNDLDEVNRRYWTRFWSHSFSDWDEIDHIDGDIHGLNLDWHRFMTHQTTDLMVSEIAAVREFSDAPATTNMMGNFTGLNYAAMAEKLDFISWDAYARWGEVEFGGDESQEACWSGFHHDLYRAMLDKPFWLVECTPSQQNGRTISKLKAPGLHRLMCWQSVAHGSDTVMYFQWRQSRGGAEKFHGAVVPHEGSGSGRVFAEVAQLGAELEEMGEIVGARTGAEVAVIYDFENKWAVEMERGPRNVDKEYQRTVLDFYRPFWKRGIAVDVVASTYDFLRYKLVVAPMLYMLRPGVAERLTEFVRAGGTLVMTYWCGLADENDLCFLTGFPGPLREVLGVRVEETDVIHPHQRNLVTAHAPELGFSGSFEAREYCELIHLEGARALGHYERDFYAGRPAFTVNEFGAGRAYFVASRNDSDFQDGLLAALARNLRLVPALEGRFPAGVVTQKRTDARSGAEWMWVMNFTGQRQEWTSLESGLEQFTDGAWHTMRGEVQALAAYDVAILRRRGDEEKGQTA